MNRRVFVRSAFSKDRKPEIGDTDTSIVIHQKVTGMEVPMYDAFVV